MHRTATALAMAAIVTISSLAQAKSSVPVDLTGELTVGQGTSSLIGKADSVAFPNDAPFVAKIFKVCQFGDICRITGKKDINDVLIELKSVKLIRKAAF